MFYAWARKSIFNITLGQTQYCSLKSNCCKNRNYLDWPWRRLKHSIHIHTHKAYTYAAYTYEHMLIIMKWLEHFSNELNSNISINSQIYAIWLKWVFGTWSTRCSPKKIYWLPIQLCHMKAKQKEANKKQMRNQIKWISLYSTLKP